MDYSKFRKIKITNDKIDFWFKNNRNVLLVGKHGVGKTTQIIEGFERNGLVLNESFKVFSGGTLDPWTDFIGVPKRVTAEDGKEHLEYILPEYMDDSLEAIFMDEYNRTNPKVRNALMELIQFKSINGKKFPNLKVVWAAVNPDEDGYDVDEVDDAQGDRFHVIVNLPYEPDLEYFNTKFGRNHADQAVKWWHNQPKEAKDMISPRRLDYCLEYYNMGGDVGEMLPIISAVEEFKYCLTTSANWKRFLDAFAVKDILDIKTLLNDENSFEDIKTDLLKDKGYFTTISLHLKTEKLNILLMENDTFFDWCVANCASNTRLLETMKDIYEAIDDESKFNQHRLVNLKSIFKTTSNKNNKFIIYKPNAPKLDLNSFSELDNAKEKLLDKIHFFQERKDKMSINDAMVFFRKVHLYTIDPVKLPTNTKKDYLIFVNDNMKKSQATSFMNEDINYCNSIIGDLVGSNSITSSEILNIFKDTWGRLSNCANFALSEKEVVDVGDVVIL